MLSGKTTLLVAKLAILAKKWPHATRGICVLSHTNVAREEIERKLGNTTIGQRLLSYPHHIGTIHGFVNTFVALPWLRSGGISISAVRDDVTLQKRWASLPDWVKKVPEERRITVDNLKASSVQGEPFPIRCGRGVMGKDKSTYIAVEGAIKRSMADGFYTYNEVFMFADEALACSGVIENIRSRFPVCFVDEAQDCSEEQSRIIATIFPADGAIHRQRFGDGNQAIFNSYESKGAETDIFPNTGNVKQVSDSMRLNSKITALADPLGLIPYSMVGKGGVSDVPPQNVIFLYGEDTIEKVLPAYGELLLDTFTDAQLDYSVQSGCYAVGQVHRIKDKLCVRDYWPSYNPEGAMAEPSPECMSDYFRIGVDKASLTGNVADAINLIAKGIVKYLHMTVDSFDFPQTKYPHRKIKHILTERGADESKYSDWMATILDSEITSESWDKEIKPVLVKWASVIAWTKLAGTEDFLKWNDDLVGMEPDGAHTCSNIYKHTNSGRSVGIQLGSIHSVKGQTHLSTLVLDTVWYKENLVSLVDWLTQDKRGASGAVVRDVVRLKCHYVAMTRPTDLLCLAINKIKVPDEIRQKLDDAGWKVEEV